MRKTSRIVTVVGGAKVIEVTAEEIKGSTPERYYYVHGERYQTLQEAREAARGFSEEEPQQHVLNA
ncbi:MAG: hypothetical protein ABSC19_06890 [Syntrophorhabdales bacterium]|jgi:hypothetical protein